MANRDNQAPDYPIENDVTDLRSLLTFPNSIRFSPRKPSSVWSISHVRRVGELISQGRMMEAGLQRVAEGRLSGQWEAAVPREQVDLIPSRTWPRHFAGGRGPLAPIGTWRPPAGSSCCTG
jgi:hypothetical protein